MALIPGTREALIGSIIEILLYGIFLPIAFTCGRILYLKHRAGRGNLYLTITFIIIYTLCTTRCIVDTERTITTWTNPVNGIVNYGDVNVVRSLLTNSLWVAETLFADAFLIYRTHVVWGRTWPIIVLPICCLLGNMASGVNVIYQMATYDSVSPLFSVLNLAINLFLYFTLFTNLMCTCFIAWRIWYVRKGTSGSRVNNRSAAGSDPVQRVVTLIVESAAIYTLLVIVQIIAANQSSFISFILIDMVPPTIGIVFCSIILRASTGKAVGDTNTTGTGNADPSSNTGRLYELRSRRGGDDDDGARRTLSEGVKIQLSRVVHTQVDGTDVSGTESVQEAGSEPDKYPGTEDV